MKDVDPRVFTRMLQKEGRTDGSVTISLRNFVGEGITKGFAERSMIGLQHVYKGKLNKCTSKARVDTVFCLTQ